LSINTAQRYVKITYRQQPGSLLLLYHLEAGSTA